MAAVVVRVRLGMEKVPHSVSPCLLLLKRGTPGKIRLRHAGERRPGQAWARPGQTMSGKVWRQERGGLSDRWRPEI